MSYLKEFLIQIKNRDFHKFLVLWEEYSSSDSVETEEFSQLLKAIEPSDLSPRFGQMIETALPLWRTIKDKDESYEILRLLIDLHAIDSPVLTDVALDALKERYGHDPKFTDHLRVIGVRDKNNLKGALSKYDLFIHMNKGNMVFHKGGWGTGEIIDVSHVREHLTIEFENISGRKDLSFTNAFKTLIPLPQHHFLARRFSNPDQLEKEGIEDPVGLIKLLLHDMGPQNAAEIKDELCELVISEDVWAKWWQSARAKVKKNSLIESPDSIREPFYLRKAELTPGDRLKSVMHNKTDGSEIISTVYSFVRDTPGALKDSVVKQKVQDQLMQLLNSTHTSEANKFQIHFLLDQFFDYKASPPLAQLIQMIDQEKIQEIVQDIEIVAFKKRAVLALKEHRSDWKKIFLNLLFTIPQTQLKDYLLKELINNSAREDVEKKLTELLKRPEKYPEMFVWYFQKLANADEADIPFLSTTGKNQFFEAFFILYSAIENENEYRDLVKKMYGMISAKRYELIRQFLKITTLEFAKEFLLLVSKCQTLSNHDIKILRSLAEVVHPSLAQMKQKKDPEMDGTEDIWTTEEGYLKVQDRIRHIGTVEVIENAREIEAARALGDLRENSEFKFAQERRARLQSELKTLSEALGRARILTPEDVHTTEVGVGNIVELEHPNGTLVTYQILGPWDANPDENILSFNSKFALAMSGKKVNDQFSFRDENYKIIKISSYFNR